jgi:hypothetical protein
MSPSLVFPLVAVGGCNSISDGPWFALPFHRCVYGCGMLVHWGRYQLGHPHTFSTVNFTESEIDRAKSVRVSRPVPAPMDKHTKTIYTPMAVRYTCDTEDGCK